MTVVTDNFNRADENPIAGNWSAPTGMTAFQLQTNVMRNQGILSDHGAYWNANSFGADQFAKFTLAEIGDGGPAVRVASGAETMYVINLLSSGGRIQRALSGSFSTIFTLSESWQIGDTIELRAVGTTITAYRNGSELTGGGVTDANIASGNVGAYAWTGIQLDDFEGGDVSAASVEQLSARGMIHFQL